MEAKRRIHRFLFDRETMKDGTPVHVALVDKAANMTEVMALKAYETPDEVIPEETHKSDGGDYRIIDEVHSIKEYTVKVI